MAGVEGKERRKVEEQVGLGNSSQFPEKGTNHDETLSLNFPIHYFEIRKSKPETCQGTGEEGNE